MFDLVDFSVDDNPLKHFCLSHLNPITRTSKNDQKSGLLKLKREEYLINQGKHYSLTSTIIGIFPHEITEKSAQQIVDNLNDKHVKYKGYEGELYSKFSLVKENNTMFILKKEGFDSMENNNPWYTDTVGVFPENITEEQVKQHVDNLNNSCEKYKGWNGKMYPIYSYESINKINIGEEK